MRRGLTILLLAVAFLAVPGSAQVPALRQYDTGFSQEAALLKQLLDEVKGLREDVRAIAGGAAPGGTTLEAVIKNRCARCHSAERAKAAGDEFVLIEKDGKLSDLSVSQKRSVVRKVKKNEMPPPPAQLSEAEKKLILELDPG